jgi:hypothetical protein
MIFGSSSLLVIVARVGRFLLVTHLGLDFIYVMRQIASVRGVFMSAALPSRGGATTSGLTNPSINPAATRSRSDSFLALAFEPLWSMVNSGRYRMLVIFWPKRPVVIQI